MILTAKNLKKFKLSNVPTINVYGESFDFCSCDNAGTKEVIYYRISGGMLKKFRETICEDCLNDPEYFIGKTIVSIRSYKSDEQEEKDYNYDHRIFTKN